MAFSQAFLEEVKARNAIEDVVGQYVTLTRRGGNLFGLCPFHSEKTGSFSVAPEKGIYYCFGCHKGGGVINFIMEIENLDFPDAVRFLAKRAGLEVPEDERENSTYRRQERLWALCKDAARFFHEQLFAPCGEEARAYIVKRALSRATVTRFGLGYSPNEWSALLDAMVKKGIHAHLTPSFDDAEAYLRAHWQPGDVVVTLGCGDIDLLNEQIARNGDTHK